MNNYAFIDSQNLNLAIRDCGWKIDFKKFRIYLKEKYKVTTAYIFIWYMSENQDLYSSLQKDGYVLIFKDVLKYKDGTVKWNVDAELVLQAMIDIGTYLQAVIISWDGDFSCLIKYLHKQNKLLTVLVPNEYKYSALIKKTAQKNIAFVNRLKSKLELVTKKEPQ